MQNEKRESYNPLLKSYPDSEKVNSVSIGAETLFTRLIAQSDDRAHYYGDPAMILGKLYTHRMAAGQVTLKEIVTWEQELVKSELVETYTGSDGKRYIEIINCKKSLRHDLKQDIRFPFPIRDGIETESSRIRDTFGPSTQPNPTQEESMSANADALTSGTPDKPQSVAAQVRGADELPPGFARWWAAWPRHHRKQGRAKCLKFWKAHKLEKISDQVIDALHRCTSSHDWQKRDGEFIPMPMTWLNRTPWETDPADMPAGTAPIDDDGPTVPGADEEQVRLAEAMMHDANGRGHP